MYQGKSLDFGYRSFGIEMRVDADRLRCAGQWDAGMAGCACTHASRVRSFHPTIGKDSDEDISSKLYDIEMRSKRSFSRD
jgi:hypothetical protein